MRIVIVTLTVAGALAACGGGVASSASGGLFGKVVISPATPVCRVGESCTKPAAHLLLVFTRPGTRAQTRTHADGTYRIALSPGRYSVRPSPQTGIGRGLEPRTALVPRARYARVNFSLDTGIR